MKIQTHLDQWHRKTDAKLELEWDSIAMARASGVPFFHGSLSASVRHPDGESIDYGLVGLKTVTTAGAEWLVRVLTGQVAANTMRYHGVGTSNTAESSDQTYLLEEINWTTSGMFRTTGSCTTGEQGFIYKSLAQIQFTAAVDITEHGIFDEPRKAMPAVMFDRTVFEAIPVVTSSMAEFSYELWFNAGG
jgi:hypothetical protein